MARDPLRFTAPHPMHCLCSDCAQVRERHPYPWMTDDERRRALTPEDGQTVATPEDGQARATRDTNAVRPDRRR